MSFARTLRTAAPLRAAVRSAAAPAIRRHGYATAAPQAAKGGNTLLLALAAAGLIGGGAYYTMNSGTTDPTKVVDAASTSEVDYQK